MPGSYIALLISAARFEPKWVKCRLIKSNHEISTGITTSYNNTPRSPLRLPLLCLFTAIHSVGFVSFVLYKISLSSHTSDDAKWSLRLYSLHTDLQLISTNTLPS